MNAGFTVEQGAVFQAFIDGCNNGSGGVNLSGNATNNLEMQEESAKAHKEKAVNKKTILKDIIQEMNDVIQTVKKKK